MTTLIQSICPDLKNFQHQIVSAWYKTMIELLNFSHIVLIYFYCEPSVMFTLMYMFLCLRCLLFVFTILYTFCILLIILIFINILYYLLAASAPSIPVGFNDSDVDSDQDEPKEREVALMQTADSAFNEFFQKSESQEKSTEKLDVNVDDFDQIFIDSENM